MKLEGERVRSHNGDQLKMKWEGHGNWDLTWEFHGVQR